MKQKQKTYIIFGGIIFLFIMLYFIGFTGLTQSIIDVLRTENLRRYDDGSFGLPNLTCEGTFCRSALWEVNGDDKNSLTTQNNMLIFYGKGGFSSTRDFTGSKVVAKGRLIYQRNVDNPNEPAAASAYAVFTVGSGDCRARLDLTHSGIGGAFEVRMETDIDQPNVSVVRVNAAGAYRECVMNGTGKHLSFNIDEGGVYPAHIELDDVLFSIPFDCRLESGEQLGRQSFDGTGNIDKFSFAVPPVKFCPLLKAVKGDPSVQGFEETSAPYDELSRGLQYDPRGSPISFYFIYENKDAPSTSCKVINDYFDFTDQKCSSEKISITEFVREGSIDTTTGEVIITNQNDCPNNLGFVVNSTHCRYIPPKTECDALTFNYGNGTCVKTTDIYGREVCPENYKKYVGTSQGLSTDLIICDTPRQNIIPIVGQTENMTVAKKAEMLIENNLSSSIPKKPNLLLYLFIAGIVVIIIVIWRYKKKN